MFNVCKCDPLSYPLTCPDSSLLSSAPAGHRPAPLHCTLYSTLYSLTAHHNLARNAKLGSKPGPVWAVTTFCFCQPAASSVSLLHLLSAYCICQVAASVCIWLSQICIGCSKDYTSQDAIQLTFQWRARAHHQDLNSSISHRLVKRHDLYF